MSLEKYSRYDKSNLIYPENKYILLNEVKMVFLEKLEVR
jgi:hypothetical protein